MNTNSITEAHGQLDSGIEVEKGYATSTPALDESLPEASSTFEESLFWKSFVVVRQLVKLALLAWGVLCLYSGVRIMMLPAGVHYSHLLIITSHFAIGVAAWAVACMQND